ncbi:MAG: phosphoribosylanthranilate isomerase [Bacillaceae bacterium]
MKVKICGITDLQTATYACQDGVDALGFVFAQSKRKITPDEAKYITTNIPMNILKIGVFVNEEIETVQHIYDSCLLDYVQLHGDEDEQYVWKLKLPTIKAFSVTKEQDIERALCFPSEYVLFDSPRGKQYGGNGTLFNWDLLKKRNITKKIILAGGLNKGNVTEAIQVAHPYMVDVSSGVERNGQKDRHEMRQFIKKAKGAMR